MKKVKFQNEISARNYIIQCGAEIPRNKVITKKYGFKGLKACSCLDYLKNYHGYHIYLTV